MRTPGGLCEPYVGVRQLPGQTLPPSHLALTVNSSYQDQGALACLDKYTKATEKPEAPHHPKGPERLQAPRDPNDGIVNPAICLHDAQDHVDKARRDQQSVPPVQVIM